MRHPNVGLSLSILPERLEAESEVEFPPPAFCQVKRFPDGPRQIGLRDGNLQAYRFNRGTISDGVLGFVGSAFSVHGIFSVLPSGFWFCESGKMLQNQSVSSMGKTPHMHPQGFQSINYSAMKDNKSTKLQGEPASARLKDQTAASPRILVVEDDIDVRHLNLEVLIGSGYQVDAAADGAAAWDALIADSYDLMITDNNMPKLTGVELLKKLRSARMELPVIMATGVLPTEEFTRCPWLQPAATLVKPYTVDALLEKVKAVLREANSDPGQLEPSPE